LQPKGLKQVFSSPKFGCCSAWLTLAQDDLLQSRTIHRLDWIGEELEDSSWVIRSMQNFEQSLKVLQSYDFKKHLRRWRKRCELCAISHNGREYGSFRRLLSPQKSQ